MPRVDAVVSCPIHDSFRVQQVAGMFDVPLAERLTERFSIEIPDLGDDWQIGLIVGPSGSGKSTIARHLFPAHLTSHFDWAPDRAVIDHFGELPIKSITSLLTSVGFGSPPSWIKPYAVLSNGERFRCDLARAIAQAESGDCASGERPLVVFDEFTSVVDRTVARIGSAALAKAIRSAQVRTRFVAASCHYDIEEWLEPDWTLDMSSGSFQRRGLRRPPIELSIFRCERTAWSMFRRHHYLSGSLPRAARCFVACWNDTPVAFCATVSLIGRKRRWRITRLVTLPDFQGVGIGMRLAEAIGNQHRAAGERLNVTASHPSLLRHCARSPLWRTVGVRSAGIPGRRFIANYRGAPERTAVSFEYTGGLREQNA